MADKLKILLLLLVSSTFVALYGQDCPVYEITLKNGDVLRGYIKKETARDYTFMANSWKISVPVEMIKGTTDGEQRKTIVINDSLVSDWIRNFLDNSQDDGLTITSVNSVEKNDGKVKIQSHANRNREIEVSIDQVRKYDYPLSGGLLDRVVTVDNEVYVGNIVRINAKNDYVIKTESGIENIPTKTIKGIGRVRNEAEMPWLEQARLIEGIELSDGTVIDDILIIDRDFENGKMTIVDHDDFTQSIPLNKVRIIRYQINPGGGISESNYEEDDDNDTQEEPEVNIAHDAVLINGKEHYMQYFRSKESRLGMQYIMNMLIADVPVILSNEVTLTYNNSNASDFGLIKVDIDRDNMKKNGDSFTLSLSAGVVDGYPIESWKRSDLNNGAVTEKTYRLKDGYYLFRSIELNCYILLRIKSPQ